MQLRRSSCLGKKAHSLPSGERRSRQMTSARCMSLRVSVRLHAHQHSWLSKIFATQPCSHSIVANACSVHFYALTPLASGCHTPAVRAEDAVLKRYRFVCSLGFDVDGLRVRSSNMLYPSAHVSCSVERRGVASQQFQVRTCVINECV